MTDIDVKKARLYRYFKGKPIIWVPFWGISKLRRRGRSFAGEIPGDMLSYDKWYARMLSADTFDSLAEMGVNLVILPFSLGGTGELEKQEHEDFRQAAALCAQRNIVVLPYLQYQNILQESTLQNFDTFAVAPGGGVRSDAYYRRTLCQSSEDFRSYFKGLIRKAQNLGANGVWIDNTYLHPCVCPECREKFARFLQEERPQLLEELKLIPEKVEIPEYISTHSNDPVMQSFHDFNMKRNLENMQIFRDEMLKYNPDGLFASNPALHLGKPNAFSGVDFLPFAELHDILYIENAQTVDVEEGVRLGNYRAFADCEAAGVAAVSGGWRHKVPDPGVEKSFVSKMPEPYEIAPAIFEPLLGGSMTGAFWLIRETPDKFCTCGGDKERGYFEYPPMKERLQSIFSFVKKLPGESFNPASTGVLFAEQSWKFDYGCFESSRYSVTEALSSANIPWRMVTDLEDTKELKLLVVPTARCMSDELIGKLEKKAQEGVQILLVGADSGYFNENMLRRNDSPLALLAGSSRYGKEPVSHCGNWHLLRDDGVRGSNFQHLSVSGAPFCRARYLMSGTLAAMVRELNPAGFTVEGDVAAVLRCTPEKKEYMLLLDYTLPERTSQVSIEFDRLRKGIYHPLAGESVAFEQEKFVINEFRTFGFIEFFN